MAIKIEMLRCFVSVVQNGSLSEAAAALGRTPSAVSMMLKQFEDHVGAPLFETTRKSKLTALGALIYDEALRGVGQFDNAVSVIRGLGRSTFGYLRLAVTPSVATNVLPPVILAYTRAWPGVEIEIRDMDSAAINQALGSQAADIGIGTLPQTGDLSRSELFSDRFGVVCRADHPLAMRGGSVDWSDMQGHVMIANGLCRLITAPRFAPVLAASQLTVPNTASLIGLVRAGVGISVLPRLAAEGAPEDVVFLPLRDTDVRRVVHIVAHPAPKLMPAAQEFLTLVAEMKTSGALNLPD